MPLPHAPFRKSAQPTHGTGPLIPCAPSRNPVLVDGQEVPCDTCGTPIKGRIRKSLGAYSGRTLRECWACWSSPRSGLRPRHTL